MGSWEDRKLRKVELCAPAGNLPSLKAAVDNGADAVYLGFSGPTNLRNFPGLNFVLSEVEEGIKYAHRKNKKVYLTVNSYPQKEELGHSFKAIDCGYQLEVDALIISDLALLEYAREKYPDLRLHVSVQAGISNYQTVEFYKRNFNIKRVVLPRILTTKEIRELKESIDIEIEVFGLGLLCINCEGRCFLSSYLTSESINTYGACSPPYFVKFTETDKLRVWIGSTLINEYDKGKAISYPTPCKGIYYNKSTKKLGASIQDPQSLNVLKIMPQIIESGIDALKIEGRQRSKTYTQKATGYYRKALDRYYENPADFKIQEKWFVDLIKSFEGLSFAYGCYVEK